MITEIGCDQCGKTMQVEGTSKWKKVRPYAGSRHTMHICPNCQLSRHRDYDTTVKFKGRLRFMAMNDKALQLETLTPQDQSLPCSHLFKTIIFGTEFFVRAYKLDDVEEMTAPAEDTEDIEDACWQEEVDALVKLAAWDGGCQTTEIDGEHYVMCLVPGPRC
jgi:hypothetical protein